VGIHSLLFGFLFLSSDLTFNVLFLPHASSPGQRLPTNGELDRSCLIGGQLCRSPWNPLRSSVFSPFSLIPVLLDFFTKVWFLRHFLFLPRLVSCLAVITNVGVNVFSPSEIVYICDFAIYLHPCACQMMAKPSDPVRNMHSSLNSRRRFSCCAVYARLRMCLY